MKEKKVLVTGGAGFIGSHLVEELTKENDVTVVDNLYTGKKENIPDGVNFIEADISDSSSLEVLEKQDMIFHLAAQTSVLRSVEDPRTDFKYNVLGTLNVLELAKKWKCKIVYSSSCAVYGDAIREPVDEEHPLHPKAPYAATKLAAEKLIEAYSHSYGIKAACLRFFNVYGPRQSGDYAGVVSIFLKKAMKNQDLTIFGDGKQYRDYVYVKDVVKALIASAEKDCQLIINVGTGKGTSVNEIADMVLKASGADVEIVHKPEKPGESRGIYADITVLKDSLGFAPEMILKDGIKNTYAWIKHNG
ncbi:NAD-dependent epimerase/dehydratase family protein [Candidatus Undinarchaeota archaeon]